MRFVMFLLLMAIGGYANGHQFTPTYPKLESSHVSGVLKVRMELFNSRKDVRFYEMLVYDGEWNPLVFAVQERIINVEYLSRKYIDIYIREQDKDKVVYICSKSKLTTNNPQATIVSSRICSKIK